MRGPRGVPHADGSSFMAKQCAPLGRGSVGSAFPGPGAWRPQTPAPDMWSLWGYLVPSRQMPQPVPHLSISTLSPHSGLGRHGAREPLALPRTVPDWLHPTAVLEPEQKPNTGTEAPESVARGSGTHWAEPRQSVKAARVQRTRGKMPSGIPPEAPSAPQLSALVGSALWFPPWGHIVSAQRPAWDGV